MEPLKILTASYLDILFEGRNKAYGAYQLRISEASRIWKALGITGIIVIVAGLFMFLGKSNASTTDFEISGPIKISSITPPEEKVEKLPEPIKQAKATPPPVEVETIKLTTPIITDKVDVKVPPTQDDLANVKIGTDTKEGIKGGDLVIIPEQFGDEKGILGGIGKEKKEEKDDFIKIEKEAAYIGGNPAWLRFLDRNLSTEVAVDNGAPEGTYKVLVQFIVDVNGVVSDVKAITKVGYGMEQEAIKAIKKSGKWEPAIQNGRAVKTHKIQPITFRVLPGE